jgi:hypothetical protein
LPSSHHHLFLKNVCFFEEPGSSVRGYMYTLIVMVRVWQAEFKVSSQNTCALIFQISTYLRGFMVELRLLIPEK